MSENWTQNIQAGVNRTGDVKEKIVKFEDLNVQRENPAWNMGSVDFQNNRESQITWRPNQMTDLLTQQGA